MCLAGFAIVVWEMATLRRSYDGYSQEEIWKDVIRGGDRPAVHKVR